MTTTVYLPRGSVGATSQLVNLKAEDVFNALDAAGIKWVLESLEEFKVRMMQTQIDEMRQLLRETSDQKEALTRVGKQLKLENEHLKAELGEWDKSHAELHAETVRLKSELFACREANNAQGNWIERLQDEQGQLKAEVHFLKGGKGKEVPE